MMTAPDLYKTFDAEEPITNLEPGMSLAGRYTLIKQIGRGGMGVIWSAEERAAGRKVVLKFVPRELKNFESAVAQIKESFQKIHGLQHQHICPVYTLEEEVSFGYYLVMKWLDGETLDEYIVRTVGRKQPLPFEDVLRILRPVADALDYAHSQRIIHRDIKPSNIFVILNEQKSIRDVQVIDFGLAAEIRSSLSRVSQVRFDTSGTRPYMAPEQWRGRLQSATTDQYSLAVTAYEMLAGHLPFEGDDAEMLRMAIVQDPPEMWKRVMGNNPSEFKGDKRLPVEQVSWDDCQVFIKKLNDALKRSGDRISLPTEAQWEYACRADTTTAYYFGDDWRQLEHYAWYSGHKNYDELMNSEAFEEGDPTHSVGTKKPNAWGLYDMLGNVDEWCSDWFGDYPSGAVTDPVGPSLGTDCVLRGGSRGIDAEGCRSAGRGGDQPSRRIGYIGLRLSLVSENE